MIVIELTYKKPLEEVDKFLEEHRRFLDKYYALGVFIASGPKEPRNGGIIIALDGQCDMQAILKNDPFYQQGIAEYKITTFHPVKYCLALKSLLN